MSRPFEARYGGRCACCDEFFERGAAVCFEDDEIVLADHASKPKPDARPAEVCTTCWLVKPCDCEDGR